MLKRLWKFLLFCLLLPVFPILHIENGDNGTNGKGSGDDKGSTGKKDDDDDDDDDDKGKEEEDKIFSQTQVDALIGRRLVKAQKAWETAKKEADEASKLSEVDRLKKEKEDAKAESAAVLEKANDRLKKADAIIKALALKIIDPDAAYILMSKEDVEVSKDGKVIGVDEALKALIKEKPYLVGEGTVHKTGDNQNENKDKKPTGVMNDLIRRAAGH